MYINERELAYKYDVSEKEINNLCKKNHFIGVIYKDGLYHIPKKELSNNKVFSKVTDTYKDDNIRMNYQNMSDYYRGRFR